MQNYLVLCCSNTTYVLMAIFQANLDHSTFHFLFLPLPVFEDNLWSLAVHFSWYDWLPLPVCPCEVFTHWNPPPHVTQPAHKTVSEFLVCPESLPLHEVFYFSAVSDLRNRICATPRSAIRNALMRPYNYLKVWNYMKFMLVCNVV